MHRLQSADGTVDSGNIRIPTTRAQNQALYSVSGFQPFYWKIVAYIPKHRNRRRRKSAGATREFGSVDRRTEAIAQVACDMHPYSAIEILKDGQRRNFSNAAGHIRVDYRTKIWLALPLSMCPSLTAS
jgi:hypothetical protein